MSDDFLPFLVFSVPIIAVTGGVIAGVVRAVGRQRVAELAYRERIAAVERGIDPSRLPPPPLTGDDRAGQDEGRSLVRWLIIVGLVMVFGSAGVVATIAAFDSDPAKGIVGTIPLAVGVALLISAWIVRPRNGSSHTPS